MRKREEGKWRSGEEGKRGKGEEEKRRRGEEETTRNIMGFVWELNNAFSHFSNIMDFFYKFVAIKFKIS